MFTTSEMPAQSRKRPAHRLHKSSPKAPRVEEPEPAPVRARPAGGGSGRRSMFSGMSDHAYGSDGVARRKKIRSNASSGDAHLSISTMCTPPSRLGPL